jgi:hypothetical protein
MYEIATSHDTPPGLRITHKPEGSLIATAATGCWTSRVGTHTAVSYDRAYLIVDTGKLCVGSSRVHAYDVLCAESRNLGSLVSDLLLVQSIKASLNSGSLVVQLVIKSQERTLDLVAVGSYLFTDVVQTSQCLSGLNSLLITSATVTHRLHSISSRGSCICRVGRPAIRVSRSTGPVTQSASDYSG